MDKPQLRVLIVEDSLDDAELVVRLIEKGGYSVNHERVDTAQQMKDALKNNVWDIIISDYKMPSFSGIKALEILNESGLDIPFILVSGTIGEDLAVEAMRKGANDYLMKDNLSRLVPAIKREIKDCKIRANGRKIVSQLGESEEKFRELFEMSPDSIVAVDLKGFVTSCNSAYEKFTGYSKEETIGKHFTKLPFLNLKDIPSYLKIFSGLLRNKKPVYFENTWTRKDGTVHFAEVVTGIIKKENKIVGFQSVTRDITERKKMQQELIESEEKFRSYVENAPEGIFIADEKGNYVDVNDAACKVTGYTREDLLKMNLIDLIPLENRENAAKSFASVVEQGKSSAETSFIKKGGEKRYWIVEAVNLSEGRFLGFTKDITERKNAELDLIQNEKKYRTLFEDTINPIWTTSLEGIVIDTNQAAAELLGYSKEELIGSSVYRLYVDPDRRKQLIAEIEEKGFVKDFLAQWKTKDGRQLDLLFNFTLWKDNDGNVMGYRGMAHDMTLHYRSEKQLGENLEYFAHLIDHIRNPLAILSGFTQVEVENEKTKERLMRQIDRIEELIKQLDQGWMDTESTRKFLKRYM